MWLRSMTLAQLCLRSQKNYSTKARVITKRISMIWKNTRNLIKSEAGLVPKEEKGAQNHSLDIVEWTEKYRTIKGKPFRFEKRDYLKQIYRDPGNEIYIAKPRQMEITELAINWLLYHLLKYPNTVSLYVTDRHDHIAVFS